MKTHEIGVLNESSSLNEKIKLGNRLGDLDNYGVLTFAFDTAGVDATSGLVALTAPFDLELIEVVVLCTATVGSGTLKVRKGTNDVSDAIACDTISVIGRSAVIDDAYNTLNRGETFTVISNGATDQGVVELVCRKL